jgi:hypothetical protein
MTVYAKYKESVEAPRTGGFMDKRNIECRVFSSTKKLAHDGKIANADTPKAQFIRRYA